MSRTHGAKTSGHMKSGLNAGKRARTTPADYVPAPPISPGEALRKYIFGSRITQERLADAMQVSRFSVNQIVNGRRSVTADMALRLAHVTSTSPELWLNLQQEVDLYRARLKLSSTLDKLPVLRSPKSERELFSDMP
jgi:addiction module HigA family antidote